MLYTCGFWFSGGLVGSVAASRRPRWSWDIRWPAWLGALRAWYRRARCSCEPNRDQPKAYDRVAAEPWDVVVDVSGQPGQVRAATAALIARTGFFVFISTGNVYADHSIPGQDETAPLLLPLAVDVMKSRESYGEAKVACERHVLDAFSPDRTLIVRAGLIGGPGDTSDRTGYWPLRFARPAAPDGSVLVPDAPGECIQVVDVRDLADGLSRREVAAFTEPSTRPAR